MHKILVKICLVLVTMSCLPACAVIERASGEAQTQVEIHKPDFRDGCEWSSFIGLSDPSLNALITAKRNPETASTDAQLIRADLERVAAQDKNWLDNCGETKYKDNSIEGVVSHGDE